jgi:hypothetical protein
MARKKKRKRGGGYSLGSIWDLSTQLMDQQLGPERAATTDQFRRDLATLQGSMNSFNAGSNMAQRSIDEVQNLATGQAQANANTAMSGMNSLAAASRDAMAPWVASTNSFIGGQGAPDLAMNEVTNMGMGSPVSFLMEAGPVAAAAAGEAHDVALNQKHDQEILQDQIDNQKNQIQGNINELHNAYRDKMSGLMGQAVQWKPEDFANYLKLTQGRKQDLAKNKQDYAALNAGLGQDAAEANQKLIDDAKKTRGKQTKAHTTAVKNMKADIASLQKTIRNDDKVRYEIRTITRDIPLTRAEQRENDLAAQRGEPLPNPTTRTEEVKVLRGLSAQRQYVSQAYRDELATLAKTYAIGARRLQQIIMAALRYRIHRPGENNPIGGY